MKSRPWAWLQSIDMRVVLIAFLVAVSTGHVGRLFADREAQEQRTIGYLLALSIDGVMAVALYEVARARGAWRKRLALGSFIVASIISGTFNMAYYRKYYHTDPPWLSLALGITAPLLAAFLAILKSLGDAEYQEAQEQVELKRLSLQLETEAQIAVAIEAEKTARAKERTKQQRLRAKERERQEAETARQRAEMARQDKETLRQALLSLGKALDALKLYADNPTLSRTDAAERLGISRQTLGKYLGKLEEMGVAQRNGKEVHTMIDVEWLRGLP